MHYTLPLYETHHPVSVGIKIPVKGPYTPKRQTSGSAGFDLECQKDVTIYHNEQVILDLGIAVSLPKDHVGFLLLRSSLGKQGLCMPNGAGVIDSDYRGTLKLIVRNLDDRPIELKAGQRLCQLVIVPCPMMRCVQVDALEDTARGENGLGSTGQ